MTGNRLENVHTGKNEWHGCKHGSRGTCVLQEQRDGRAHDNVHTCPWCDHGKRPEAADSIGIVVNGTRGDFSRNVISTRDADRNKEEQHHGLAEPAIDGGRHQGVNIKDIHIEVGGEIDPWEPDAGAKDIPLGNIDVITTTHPEGDHHPDGDGSIGGQQYGPDKGRKLHPVFTGAVTGENAAGTQHDCEVPDVTGNKECAGIFARLARQTGHQPNHHPKGSLGTPTVDESVDVRWEGTAILNEGVLTEKGRVVCLDRGDNTEDQRDSKPSGATCEKEHHRVAQRTVDV